MQIINEKYNWNGGFTSRFKTNYIVLHHAEAVKCTAQDVHSWHRANGWTGIGYHFFVRKDGTIYRGRPINVVGAHVQGMNSCSVGICAEGDYHTKEKTMPQAQKKSIIELCQYLKKNYYPNAKIVGHREIGDSNCPGRYYPLDEIKNMKYTEGLTMEQYNELKSLIEKQAAEINDLREVNKQLVNVVQTTMVYDYVDDNMPDWARPAVQAAMDCGAVLGDENGRLGLSYKDLRAICREFRCGLYNR